MVKGWRFAVGRLQLGGSFLGTLQSNRTNGTNGIHETYVLLANCQPQTANRKLLTLNPDPHHHLDFYQCVPG
jgi:hypothetical protein